MKKVGILTINDDNNYGNRLQNYATQEILKKRNLKVQTITNLDDMQGLNYLKKIIKSLIKEYIPIKPSFKRYKNFMKFNKKINYASGVIEKGHVPLNLKNKYDYFITGSDQVWNPTFGRMSEIDLLEFAPTCKRNSLSASFGISELPDEVKNKAREGLNNLKNISVREERAKEIVSELTGRQDVEVLVDPTMMLSEKEWSKIAKKPSMLKSEKYILNYFLGELSNDKKEEIEKVAHENNCEIINILDKQSPFYICGPSEFVYLEKNAFLVCTDSFHSCIFAILFNRPFIVFDRKQQNVENMNSRLDTLLKKFYLTEHSYKGKIEKKDITANYKKANQILNDEKIKFEKFLDKIFEGEN